MCSESLVVSNFEVRIVIASYAKRWRLAMDISFFDIDKKPKILRDLVHGYIALSKFDLKIIDTPHFQRLKDVRQLTTQHVYPDARHTRFEHSLGVMELTRQAIKYLNENKFLSAVPEEMKKIVDGNERIIDKDTEFNTSLAALLHDIGHCPFSHLGERQFEDDDDDADNKPMDKLRKDLVSLVREKKIMGTEPRALTKSIENHKSPHELLSCIIILRVYYVYFKMLKKDIASPNAKPDSTEKEDALKILDRIDFEFIIRCILGIPYENASSPEISIKNIMVGLISSDALDMDKLDYIMRDAFYTGINVPQIDTKRLFKNMYISWSYKLVYTTKAVPVLQNIIESRDNLYLWVYNHHTVVYTDYLYYYIFRRLHHNALAYERKVQSDNAKTDEKEKMRDEGMDPIAGRMKRDALFSVRAIKTRLASDSTLQYYLLHSFKNLGSAVLDKKKPLNAEEKRVYFLLWHLFRRELLKPWWKTIFEYEHFMNTRIFDDRIRATIAQRICSDDDNDGIKAAEFRSQIAKGVILLSKEYGKEYEEKYRKEGRLKTCLKDGDFFIVERSNRFYTLRAIGNFTVYLKKNEFVDPSLNTEDPPIQENDYFGKSLSKLLPQKNHENFFSKASFYLYIRPYEDIRLERETFTKYVDKTGFYEKREDVLSNEETSAEDADKTGFYEQIEKLFVSVSTCLASMNKMQFHEYCREYENARRAGEIPKALQRIKKNLDRDPLFRK
jgi:HD superfamily phosphohydrolase